MRYILCIFVLTALLGCASGTQSPNLYQRLGGEPGVDAIVYQLIVNISQDERVIERFRGVDIERFRTGLVQYICSVSSEECQYQGDSMQVVHAGHDYTDTEFNAIVENLMKAMESQKVPTRVQNELLAILAKDYDSIVYR